MLAQVQEEGPKVFLFSRIDVEESEEEEEGAEKKGGAKGTKECPKKAVCLFSSLHHTRY